MIELPTLTLADLLRANKSHLSMSLVNREDGSIKWQVNRKNKDGSYTVEIHSDPVVALMRILISSR